jgi:hypothetical protein
MICWDLTNRKKKKSYEKKSKKKKNFSSITFKHWKSLFVLHGDHLQQHAVDPPTIILVQNVVLRLNAHIVTLHAYIVNLITMSKS